MKQRPTHFAYVPSLHIGATDWCCIAAQGGNPYQIPHGRGRGSA